MRIALLAALVLLASSTSFTALNEDASAVPAAAQVQIAAGDLYFCSPASQDSVCETSITVGDTVLWTNVGGFHTVTQCSGGFSTCPAPGGFDSGQLTASQTFEQTFTTPGVAEYLCLNHPDNMRGRISVAQASAQETTTPASSPTTNASGGTSEPTATQVQPGTVGASDLPAGGGAPGSASDQLDMTALAALGGLIFLIAAAFLAVVRISRR
jgi:plastocyanin